MTTITKQTRIPSPILVAPESTWPPTAAMALAGADRAPELPPTGEVRIAAGAGATLLSARVARASTLKALDLQRAVCALYMSIAENLFGTRHPHALRFWNFIPHIHARMGSRAGSAGGIMDRYMVFNAGRFAAYSRWYGPTAGPMMATATGIGHSGEDLVVHCLAGVQPGRAVENPRQVPAYRYSTRRGPLPPCFARATAVTLGDEHLLMVGGTSSVRGESSMHPGDLDAQIGETLTNMAALVVRKADPTERERRQALLSYRSLRVYSKHNANLDRARRLIEARFASAESIEYVRADVCRRTLLVEIEGVASL